MTRNDVHQPAEAELPQRLRRLAVPVDHLVNVVDVELIRSVALDRGGYVLDETRELGLVVGRNQRPGDAPSRLLLAIVTRRHGGRA
jgi:hypothetical protein